MPVLLTCPIPPEAPKTPVCRLEQCVQTASEPTEVPRTCFDHGVIDRQMPLEVTNAEFYYTKLNISVREAVSLAM